MKQLIAAVRAHAEQHYNEGGWDFLVECWDDDYIAQEILQGDHTLTAQQAIAVCEHVLNAMDEQRQAVHNEIW